jgi:serine/threonine protein kinase/tetratricopeptide (TPR) repeat protein
MNEQRHQKIKQVFGQAYASPPDQRQALLDQECSGDPELRREVESLLAHAQSPKVDIESAAKRLHVPDEVPLIERIGSYEIREILGRGGMGVVYLAEQDRPRRAVALKVIRPGLASRGTLRRFDLEAETLGRLQHPGIAQIYDAGAADAGDGPQPYFAMELIQGNPLVDYAQEHDLDTRRRLELILKLCDAVQHAHDRGVIHRDLKPANILVDEQGQPKILDFGIARLAESDAQLATLRTETGEFVGTLPYMSPEQVSGRPDAIDTRTDVYALGVVCYELLCGSLPHDLSGTSLPEAVRLIGEDDPIPLSAVSRAFRGDLDTLVGKAMDKDLARRYPSAAAFAEDIRSYLAHRPIVARPPSTVYQLKKFTRRNKALVGGASLVLVVSVVAAIVSISFAIQESRQKRLATLRTEQLERLTEFQAAMISGVDPEQMGLSILKDLRTRTETQLTARGLDGDTVAAAMQGFDDAIRGVSATDLALGALDEHVLRRAVETNDIEFGDEPQLHAALQQSIGNTYRDIGMFSEALPLQRQAMEAFRDALGNEDPQTLESLYRLSYTLRDLGQLEEAAPLASEALDTYRRLYGNNHADTLKAMQNMALLHQEKGEIDQAMALCLQALAGQQQVLGEEHEETLLTQVALGVLLQATGRNEEAETTFREALEAHRKLFGDDDVRTMNAITRMGLLLYTMKRFSEAAEFLDESLAGFTQIYGEDHMSTLTAAASVGLVQVHAGDQESAIKNLTRALDGMRQTLGVDHPSTIGALNNLGYVYREIGQLENSANCARQAIESYRRVLGNDHWKTLVSIYNLGYVYQQLGQFDRALGYYQEVLGGRRRSLGDDHPDTIMARYRLGQLLLQMDRSQEAESLLAQAVSQARQVLAPDDGSMNFYLLYHGMALTQLGRFEDARAALAEAHAGFEAAVVNDDRTQLDKASAALSRLYVQWNEAEPDAGHDKRATEWSERMTAVPDQ